MEAQRNESMVIKKIPNKKEIEIDVEYCKRKIDINDSEDEKIDIDVPKRATPPNKQLAINRKSQSSMRIKST